MRKALLLVLFVSLLAPAVFAAPAVAASRLTFQDGLAKKEKDLREFWFKNRDGGKQKRACIFSCTNYCYWDWYWCAEACGSWEQNPTCREACCQNWRDCMTEGQCCTFPPGPEACPG